MRAFFKTLMRRRFTRTIVIVSLGIVVFFPLLDKFLIYPMFTNLIVEGIEDDAVRLAAHMTRETGISEIELGKRPLGKELIARLKFYEEDLNLMKLKIFSSRGEVVYSTEPEDVGTINQRDYFLGVVAKGRPYTKIVRKDGESLEEQKVTADVVETYVPIMKGGQFVGSFEIYYDVTDRLASLDDLKFRSSVLLFVLSFGLFSAIVAVSSRIASAEEALHKTNKELIKAERYLDNLLQNSPDAIVSNNKKGDITFFSPGATAMLGYRMEEVMGKYVGMLYESEERAKEVKRQMRMRGGKVSAFETTLRARDGSLIPALISASILYDDEGREAGVVGFNKDLRRRKKAEEEVRKSYQSQNVLNSILSVSLDDVPLEEVLGRALHFVVNAPFMSVKQQGAIFLIEKGSEELRLAAHMGLPSTLLAACDRVPLGRCFCGRVASTGKAEFSERVDIRHQTRYEGIEPHGHYAVPIISKDETLGVVLMYLDEGHPWNKREEDFLVAVANTLAGIIDRKRAEEELKDAYDALEKAQASAITAEKLAALGRLTAGATHEILNPLNIIKLIIHMLMRKPSLTEDVAEDLQVVEEQTERIFSITKGLLHFSRQTPPEPRLIDLNEVVRRTVRLINHEFKLQDVVVKMEFCEDVPPIMADGDQLQQVVVNLLTNARDAMPGGGTITLRTSACQDGGRDCVTLRVEDTGEGIPSENRDKLFEPFFTTKDEDEGTGLGLSICQGIVEAHGGAIWAEDAPDGGAAFVVRLCKAMEKVKK